MSAIIEKFQKNSFEEIQISFNQYNENYLIDIRVFYKDDNDEYKPTKKGISLNVKLFPELEKAVQKVKEFLEEKGLFRNEENY